MMDAAFSGAGANKTDASSIYVGDSTVIDTGDAPDGEPTDTGPEADVPMQNNPCDADPPSCVPDPCSDGTLRCGSVRIGFPLNWAMLPLPTDLVVIGQGFSAVGRTDQTGHVQMTLPLEQPLWVDVPAAEDHVRTQAPLFVREGQEEYVVTLFAHGALMGWHAGQGTVQDTTKSFVLVMVDHPRIAGTGLELNQPYEGVHTTSLEPRVYPGNVIGADTNGTITFINVEPGQAVPTWISPPGWACSGPFDGLYRYEPGTITNIFIRCQPDADADAGPRD
jgi:hypothetical protein